MIENKIQLMENTINRSERERVFTDEFLNQQPENTRL